MNKLSLALLPMIFYGSTTLAGFVNSGMYPLDTKATTTNIVFTIDDSGSMDFEVQLDGKKNGVNTINNSLATYVFDIEKNPYDGHFRGGTGYFTYPHTDNYKEVRDSSKNTTYYNPRTIYTPWPPAQIAGNLVIFKNSNAASARSHPLLTKDGTLNSDCTNSSNCVIKDLTKKVKGADYSIATFVVDNKIYDINEGQTWNGRSKADELQNFANWFTYYRNRRLLLSASMGKVINRLQVSYSNINAAVVFYNTGTNVEPNKLYNFTSTNDNDNGRALLSNIYSLICSEGGTPARQAMIKAGNLYYRNDIAGPFNGDGLVCSKNNQFVLTDGFGNDYEEKTLNNSPSGNLPDGKYVTLPNKTLFDIAKIYYDRIQSWSRFTDANTGQNQGNTVNTFAVTLGAKGDKFPGKNYSEITDWPSNSSVLNDSKYSIDDLWHAAESTEGKMLYANDADTLEQTITEIIRSMVKITSHTNVPVSTKYITEGDNTAVLTSFNTGDWTSEIKAHPIIIDPSSTMYGKVDTNTTTWSARELLDAMPVTDRKIATYNGSAGIGFNHTALNANNLLAPFNNAGLQDSEEVINYLRGDRSKEGSKFRTRGSRLGDIINSSPIFVTGAQSSYTDPTYVAYKKTVKTRKKMIYVGANDGMLHAFDSSNGKELWAYVPKMIHSKLIEYTKNTYLHDYFVDGQITAADVQFENSLWKTVIVGGLRSGGRGFYAVDVTTPEAETDADVAKKILWEFTDPRMGLSFGKPRIVKTSGYGWVVLLTSGYYSNSDTVSDGNGYLFVVGVEKGNLIKAIPLPNPSNTNYNSNPVGFTQIQTMALAGPETDKTGLGWLVYGGDLNGNVWRFDISAKDKENWTVRKFASKLSTDGTGRAITTAPAVGYIKTPYLGNPVDKQYSDLDNKEKRLMVYIGTGKLLEPTDIDEAADKDTKHGFFAMEDYAATLSNLSATDPENSFIYGETPCAPFGNCLVPVGLPNGNATDPNGLNNWMAESEVDILRDWWIRYKYGPINYGGFLHVRRGWFIEFSDTGSERVISDPVFQNTFVTFNTTMVTDWRHGAAGRCENVYSAQYVLGSGKGGTLGADKFKDGVAWSRMNLGFGIASSGTLFVTPDGWFNNVTNVAGEIITNTMPEQEKPGSSNSNQLRRWGWREIYR